MLLALKIDIQGGKVKNSEFQTFIKGICERTKLFVVSLVLVLEVDSVTADVVLCTTKVEPHWTLRRVLLNPLNGLLT